MWIIWPFRKKNFGLAWTVCADFRRSVESSLGSFVIQDETVLPHPKKVIFESVCVLLLTETDERILELSNLCAFELAFFQKDVGAVPLHPLGIDPELAEKAERTGQPLKANPSGKEKYDRFKLLRDADWEHMKAAMAEVRRRKTRVGVPA